MSKFSIIRSKYAGFSLLELLVVISIIGILIAISSVAFSTAQQKARDAKRRNDIKSMQTGFEQYYSQNGGEYEDSCAAMTAGSIFPGGLPTDPKTNDPYTCLSDTTANQYCICTELETGNGNASEESTTYGCGSMGATSAGNSYYCLKNLQ